MRCSLATTENLALPPINSPCIRVPGALSVRYVCLVPWKWKMQELWWIFGESCEVSGRLRCIVVHYFVSGGTAEWWCLESINRCVFDYSSVQEGIYLPEKARICSTPPLRSFPGVTFQTVQSAGVIDSGPISTSFPRRSSASLCWCVFRLGDRWCDVFGITMHHR